MEYTAIMGNQIKKKKKILTEFQMKLFALMPIGMGGR